MHLIFFIYCMSDYQQIKHQKVIHTPLKNPVFTMLSAEHAKLKTR